jgi:4-amino-4-deoxy-L-arabinose transferase-like glycosyltransferase
VTDDLTPAQRESLDALRSSRGACPPAEALVAYEALSEDQRAHHPHDAHIQVCSRCQLALLHMAEPAAAATSSETGEARRAVARKRAGGWLMPLAAVAVLAVAITLMNRSGVTPIPPANETVRGTEIQITAPAGAVGMIREFSWQSPIRAERYRVIVTRGSTVVWQAETTGLTVAPPPSGVLERDVPYEWQVEAIDREGNVRMTSPPQSFVFY